MKLSQSRQSGFTLIELLVVISIIGLLSSVVLANVASARQKARNQAFAQSIYQIQKALEIYKTSNGKYPAEGEFSANSELKDINSIADPDFIPSYISDVPDFAVDGISPIIYLNDTNLTDPNGLNGDYDCGGKPLLSGYLIYTQDPNSEIPLPIIGSGGSNEGYCVTAPN